MFVRQALLVTRSDRHVMPANGTASASTDQYASNDVNSSLSQAANHWQHSNSNVNAPFLSGYTSNQSDLRSAPACGYNNISAPVPRGYNVTDEDKLYLCADTARFYQSTPSSDRLVFRGVERGTWHYPVGAGPGPPCMDASYRHNPNKLR